MDHDAQHSDGFRDRLHTIGNYFDSPRSGIADFQGQPHVFECQFDEAADDWTDLFWLMAIDQRLFDLAGEQYGLFLRWSEKFKAGQVEIDPQRPLILPDDRARYDELVALIGDRLTVRPECSIVRKGKFLLTEVAVSSSIIRRTLPEAWSGVVWTVP